MILIAGRFPNLRSLSAYERFDHANRRRFSLLSILGPTTTPALTSLSITMTSFDVDYIHQLAQVPTLISLDLSYLGGNTLYEDFLCSLIALKNVEMMPLLQDLSLSLTIDMRMILEPFLDHPTAQVDESLAILIEARRENLRRLFLHLHSMTAEWQAGMETVPELGLASEYPGWLRTLWPNRPVSEICILSERSRVDIPFSTSEYGWITYYRDRCVCRNGRWEVELVPRLTGGWFVT